MAMNPSLSLELGKQEEEIYEGKDLYHMTNTKQG